MAKKSNIDGIVDEMYYRLGGFRRKESLIGYIKLSITKDMFNTEAEYEEFYELLGRFHEEMIMADRNRYILPPNNGFKMLMEKYPEQTDKIILENIYDAKISKDVKNALNYINDKNCFSTKLSYFITTKGDVSSHIMGTLFSSTIRSYLDNGELDKKRKDFYTTFLAADLGQEMLKIVTPEDIARCVNDTRAMPAVYFSLSNIFNDITDLDKRTDIVTQYIFGEMRNFNVDKLKLMLYYNYFKKAIRGGLFTTQKLDHLEILRDDINHNLSGITLAMDEIEFDIPDIDTIKLDIIGAFSGASLPHDIFKPKEQPKNFLSNLKENKTDSFGLDNSPIIRESEVEKNFQEFPIIVISDDSKYKIKKVSFSKDKDFSKKSFLQEVDNLLLQLKIDKTIELCLKDEKDDENTKQRFSSIQECLQGIELSKQTLEFFISRILEKVKLENPECDEKEIEEKFNTQKRLVFKHLYSNKILTLSNAIDFDFDILCQFLQNNEITITSEDFRKTYFPQDKKENIVNICINNTALLSNLINSRSITYNDLLNLNLNSYVELTEALFKSGIIDINNLMVLVKNGKVTLKQIENFTLDNISILDNDIVSIYIDIHEKKSEYELAVKANYENAIQNGIDENEVQESEEEKKLREELQDLITLKNIYITLFKKQKISNINYYHRSQDIYMEIIELCYADEDFEKSISSVTNMLYEDDFISMAQAQQFDDSLVISILKSGKAKRDDIEKFKSELVSIEEIENIRNEFSDVAEGEDLEEEIRRQVYILTYKRLSSLMEKIIADPNSSKEEKLSILYSIFSKNTITEKTHRDFFEAEILVEIYSKLNIKRKPPVIKPEDEILGEEEIEDDEEILPEPSIKNQSRKFVYSTDIIWRFMKLLDPDCKHRILSDGHVIFESEKLNKVFIENIWHCSKKGDFIRRGYGTPTLILDLDIFKLKETELIKTARNGNYKMDIRQAKTYLPMIQTRNGIKCTGIIRHNKDLNDTGSNKLWFKSILEELGITEENIKFNESAYTQEDLDKINKFIMRYRYRYEELTR